MDLKSYEYKTNFELNSYIYRFFVEKKKLTLSEIKRLLLQENVSYTEEEIMAVITTMLVKWGMIIRNDFWNQELEYIMLENSKRASSYSKHYYSFIVDNNKTKKFLLIADTHIGDENVEDFKLLNNIYDFAISKGAKKCFHLGDVFCGYDSQKNFNFELRNHQLMRFINCYPKPLPNEMMTYAVLGNRDMKMDNILWHTGFSDIYYDLRALSYFNPSFYMFPRGRVSLDFLGNLFVFSHKFHHSMLIPNLVINSVDDLLRQDIFLSDDYKVHVSGHLHRGIIYGAQPNKYNDGEQLFLGVPSTSKMNLNNVVAYLITLNYKSDVEIDSIDVEVLNCNDDYNLSIQESFNWNFSGGNDVYRKVKVL